MDAVTNYPFFFSCSFSWIYLYFVFCCWFFVMAVTCQMFYWCLMGFQEAV